MISRAYADMIVSGISEQKFELISKEKGGWYKTSTCMGFECPLDDGGTVHILWDFNAEHWDFKNNTVNLQTHDMIVDITWASNIEISDGWLSFASMDVHNHEGPNGYFQIKITDNT